MAVGQLLFGKIGDGLELVHDGEQMLRLLVGERTDGGVVEFLVVVAEGVESEVGEYFGRNEYQGIGEVVRTVDGPHDMSWQDDGQVVFVVGDDPHVVHCPCATA